MTRATALTERLGIRHPIVLGPFGGGLSSVTLTAAVSNAGGLGSFGAHHLGPDAIRDLVAELRARTSQPFAVNLWVPQDGEPTALEPEVFAAAVARLRPALERFGLPAPAPPAAFRPDFRAQVSAALAAGPPALSFVMGVPPADVLAQARSRGIAVLGTATTVAEAVALADAGVDAVVASGSDAGGHRGSFLRPVEESLVGTLSLVPQVADAVRVPVVAAGGIADGRGLAAVLALGAAGAQVGTAFLLCEESAASPAYRAVLASERARTTMLTRAFTGRLARGIPNELLRALHPDEAALPPYPSWNWLTQPVRRAAAEAGDAEHLSLWSGQSARLAVPRRAAELVDRLVADAAAALDRLR